MITTTERERARYAYECAEVGSDLEWKKEYKSYVRKIPMLVKTNGLAATFAYVSSRKNKDKAKKGYAYHTIYVQVANWLREQNYLPNEGIDMSKQLIQLDSPAYRVVTNEVLALFMWIRRFSEAMIEGEASDG